MSKKYDLLKEIDENTISVPFLEEERVIFFSFGLDKEVVKIIGDFYEKYLSNKVDTNITSKALDIENAVGSIEDLLKKLEEQPINIYKSIVKNLELYYEVVSNLASCLLSERDDKGKIVNYVSATDILHNKKYQTNEMKKLLKELFDYCLDRFNKILKENVTENEDNENPPEREGEGSD